ncbi:MAG TPA: hypothetical protein VGS22_07770 [Thermoanaerobaculia bacterium]|nr:hypothetical protein [Thermoanaerobaculia bacterium]
MTHGDEVLLFRRAADEDERLLQQTYLEQSSQRLPFEPLVAVLSGIVHVHMVSQLARPEEPAKRDAPDFDLIGVSWAIDQGTAPLLIEKPELLRRREFIRQLPRLFARASQRTGRQILVSTHSEEILADRGIDPSEIVILNPSENDTNVFLGSELPELIAAAKAGVRLGPLVTSFTKPQEIEQLSLPGSTARL